jgi:hypothetical protein
MKVTQHSFRLFQIWLVPRSRGFPHHLYVSILKGAPCNLQGFSGTQELVLSYPDPSGR